MSQLKYNSAQVDGNGNIVLQDIHNSTITINVHDEAVLKGFLSQYENEIAQIRQVVEDLKSQLNSQAYERIKHLLGAPKQLNRIPPKPQDFVGRKDELLSLKDLLQGPKPVLLLNGIGGIGKTSIALKYLHQNYESYKHILWVSVLSENRDEEKSFQTALEALSGDLDLLKNLDIPFDKDQDSKDRLKELMKKLNTFEGTNLMVLDNVGNSFEDIRQELPSSQHWQILLTSRRELPHLSIKRIDELPPEEAFECYCIHRSLEVDKPYQPDSKEQKEIYALLEHIGYHTLTIELFAKTSRISPRNSPAKILSLLKSKKLDTLKKAVPTSHSQREEEVYAYLITAFDLVREELSKAEESLLVQFSVLPAEQIEWNTLIQLFGIDEDGEDQFEENLISLVKKGWISRAKDSQSSFFMHQLIQEVIRYQLKPETENCQSIIEGCIGLLLVDQSKDNPIEKFPFIIFGDALLLHLEEQHEKIAVLQNNLALVYKVLGQYPRAAELLEKALESDLQNFGEQHPNVAIKRSNLGVVYQDLGQYPRAAELLEKALESDLQNFGVQHPTVAISRSNLAVVYQDLGQYPRAAELLEKALESAIQNFGEQHPNVAIRRSNLALVYKDLGQYPRAAELLEKALQSDIQNFGEQHPNVARCGSNLAIVYQDLGQYPRAAELLEKALKSDIQNFGEQHPNVAIRRSNLAMVYRNLGQYPRAAELLEKALASDIQNFGEQHPNVAIRRSNLAMVYRNLGQYPRAAELLEKALQSAIQNFGEQHPKVALRRSNLATVYQNLGQYPRAAELLEKALQSDLQNFGEKHPTVAISKWNLATVLIDMQKREEAKKLLSSALEIFTKTLGEEHPHTKGVKSWLDRLK